MLSGDPSNQWEWHEAFRDLSKNQYRTSYTDMSHGREVYVRSDYPAGYGGHVPSLRYDILHRNTAQDRVRTLQRADPDRDTLPSFDLQLNGLPSSTAFPCGAKKNPTKGVVPHSGWTTNPRPPWGILVGKLDRLNQHCTPATIRRSLSASSLVGAGNMVTAFDGKQAQRQPDPSSPTAALRTTCSYANEEATRGVMPSEAEVLAAEQRQM